MRSARFLAPRIFPGDEHADLRRAFVERRSSADRGGFLAALRGFVGWSITDRLGEIERRRWWSPRSTTTPRSRARGSGRPAYHGQSWWSSPSHSTFFNRSPVRRRGRKFCGNADFPATLSSQRSDLRIQLLCDGAPEMWNLLEDGFTSEKFEEDIEQLVDFPHLVSKLSAAAKVIAEAGTEEETVNRWKLKLFNRDNGAIEILEELIASGMDEGVTDDNPVHAAISYLHNHGKEGDRMNYARARRLGLAIGSGNVEVTCKSLFELRLKRCGARWKTETGQHIVQLRALALSDRWGRAIELTLRPRSRAVRAA